MLTRAYKLIITIWSLIFIIEDDHDDIPVADVVDVEGGENGDDLSSGHIRQLSK